METEARWEDDVYWREARITVIAAQAWHVIAELFRRHQRLHDLRVWELHPGISTRGLLAIRARPAAPGGKHPQLELNLGGPSGSSSVPRRLDGIPAPLVDGYPFATRLLQEDPVLVVDDISRRWGLPPVSTLPPSTAATLAARCIAAFLLRHSLDRRLYRASSAFLGLSTCDQVAGWVRPFLGEGPVSSDGMVSSGEQAPDPGLCGRANRYWLLHVCNEDGEPVYDRESLGGGGVVFDMATGTATRLTAETIGPSYDLVDLYRESGRRLHPLVEWVSKAMGA